MQQMIAKADPQNLPPLITKHRSSALRLVKSDGTIDYSTLVKERRSHETAEARASVTWRYRKTLGQVTDTSSPDSTLVTADTIPHPQSQKASESEDLVGMGKLKAKLVNEIVRVKSVYEESRGRSGTGLERKERWLGAVRKPAAARRTTELFAVSQADLHGKRKAFAEIEGAHLPIWELAKGGVSAQHPLHRGSAVLVVHQDTHWFGLGMF